MVSHIVEHKATFARKVRGTDIKVGDTLYAVKNGSLYFIWTYLDKATAEYIAGKFPDGPESLADAQANWRSNLSNLCPTGTKI